MNVHVQMFAWQKPRLELSSAHLSLATISQVASLPPEIMLTSLSASELGRFEEKIHPQP